MFGKGGPVQVRVRPLVDEMTGNVRPALLLLMAGVALVLFVACANVANLLLARGHARQREMAVRAALGAPLRRLAQQLVVESLVFAIAGGLLGLLLAWALVGLLPVVAPESFPRLDPIRLDGQALAFGLTASLLAASSRACCLPSAAPGRGSRLSFVPPIDLPWPAPGRAARSLLVVEAALAVLLIVSAGLLVRSFIRLVNVDGGFDPSNALVTQVYLPDAHQRPARPSAFFERLVPRLTQMPGASRWEWPTWRRWDGSLRGGDRPPAGPGRRVPAGNRDQLGGVRLLTARRSDCASRAAGSSSRATLTDR